MKENRKAVIVGIFLVLGVALFLFGVFFLGGQQKSFSKGIKINAIFDDVQGLKAGNAVWFSGVKIGTITKVSFVGDAQVRVYMSVDPATQQYIHRNATARISSDSFIGNKIIVLDSGSPQAPIVQDGDVLQAAKLITTDDIMKTFQQNNENLLSITGDFKLLSRKILQGKGTVGTLMADSLMAVQLRNSMRNLELTTQGAARMAAQMETFSKKVNTKGGLADQLLTDTTTFSKMKATMANLQAASKSANDFATNLKAMSGKLDSKDNVVGVLLNDPESAAHIQQTIKNLQHSSELLNEDLLAAQHNFLLRGFFKDKEKAKEDSIKKANKK